MEFTATINTETWAFSVEHATSSRSMKAFIIECPRGAYTTTRTLHHDSIMNFEAHMKRLVESWMKLNWKNDPLPVEQSIGRNEESRMTSLVSSIVESVVSSVKISNALLYTEEIYISALLEQPLEFQVLLRIHCSVQTPAPIEACTVAVYGTPRQNPVVKDSQWARLRQKFEFIALKPGINDLILSDSAGNLYEGMTSNFFVITSETSRLTIVTAPSDVVLHGTIRKLVIDICKEHKIPVEYRFPRIQETNDWVGAFITSSLRRLLPINKIEYTDDVDSKSVEFSDNPDVQGIYSMFTREIIVWSKKSN